MPKTNTRITNRRVTNRRVTNRRGSKGRGSRRVRNMRGGGVGEWGYIIWNWIRNLFNMNEAKAFDEENQSLIPKLLGDEWYGKEQ